MRESLSPSQFGLRTIIVIIWYYDREGVKFRDSGSEIERNILRNVKFATLCRSVVKVQVSGAQRQVSGAQRFLFRSRGGVGRGEGGGAWEEMGLPPRTLTEPEH
jgi:hypothetical protein